MTIFLGSIPIFPPSTIFCVSIAAYRMLTVEFGMLLQSYRFMSDALFVALFTVVVFIVIVDLAGHF